MKIKNVIIIAFLTVFAILYFPTNKVFSDSSSVRRLGNAYQYVSNQGVAAFNIPWRGSAGGLFPGIDYKGNILFWTEPGQAGTVVNYNNADTVKASSVSGTDTLPAYSADANSRIIGYWTLPTGLIPVDSPVQIKLTLNPSDINYAGVIRPLKVSLDPTTPTSFGTQLNSGIATFYPLTLSKTTDSSFLINGTNGDVPQSFEPGSYINSASQPSYNQEFKMTIIGNTSVTLVDANGVDVNTLPMVDSTGQTVGTWNVSADNSKISWSLNGNTLLGPIQQVKYSVQDIRKNSWSGWWNQSPDSAENTQGGVATYNTGFLIPSIGQLTVNYIDTENNSLSNPLTTFGYIGQSYDTQQKTIPGYSFKEVQGAEAGQYSSDDQTVTYVYSKNLVKASDVIVKYVDDQGNKISDDVVKSGNIGESYTTDKLTINGYTFKEIKIDSAPVQGLLSATPQIVTYIYSKDPVKASDVTVKYVDDQGNKISDEVVKSGNIGQLYTTDKLTINGYTFKAMGTNSAPAQGLLTATPQTVIYVYSQNIIITPNNTVPSNQTPGNSTSQASTTGQNLPSTGEETQKATLAFGIGILMVVFALIGYQAYKKNKRV